MAKKNFYAVKKGNEVGIFTTWKECENSISGFSGSEYKGFKTKSEAEAYLSGSKEEVKGDSSKNKQDNAEINYDSICVDGACAGNPGDGDYQCVDVRTNETIFLKTKFEDTTNNIMEFLALVDGIKYILENNIDKPIYSDSITAMAWVRNKKANSNLRATSKNFDSKKYMDLAEEWLKKTDISSVTILKWHTKKWGEIPADFGRK